MWSDSSAVADHSPLLLQEKMKQKMEAQIQNNDVKTNDHIGTLVESIELNIP